MMPPSKQMDSVLGIDVHIIQPPPPAPPLPIPHPFVGMVFVPLEFAPIVGATVIVHGMPAAIAGTECKCIPPHIPLGGTFVPTAPPPPSEGELFMGGSDRVIRRGRGELYGPARAHLPIGGDARAAAAQSQKEKNPGRRPDAADFGRAAHSGRAAGAYRRPSDHPAALRPSVHRYRPHRYADDDAKRDR